MATLKQIEANRRNAQKSTGPSTPEGKEHSSRNALKSGIFAESEIIIGENPADLARLRDEYLEHCRPASPIARDLVDNLVRNMWLRRRFAMIESDIFNSRYDDLIEPSHHRAFRFGNFFKTINLLDRRLNAAERNFYRALKALQSLAPPDSTSDAEPAPDVLSETSVPPPGLPAESSPANPPAQPADPKPTSKKLASFPQNAHQHSFAPFASPASPNPPTPSGPPIAPCSVHGIKLAA